MNNPYNFFTTPLHRQNTIPTARCFNAGMNCELSGKTPVAHRYTTLLLLLLSSASVLAPPSSKELAARNKSEGVPSNTQLIFHQMIYEAKVTDEEARFLVTIDAESVSKQEVAQNLFEGELALLPAKLPPPLRSKVLVCTLIVPLFST